MNKKQRYGLFGMLSLIFSLIGGLSFESGESAITLVLFTLGFIMFTNFFLKD